jgi:uncharacterized protein (UPF0332 family)
VSDDDVRALLARASEELGAVQTLLDAGFHEQADSRAYYAAFYAAEAALLALGETRSKHSAVISAFGRIAVKDGGFDPDVARALRTLFDLRNSADYDWLDSSRSDDEDPLSLARPFVDAVAAWIAQRPGPAGA